MRTFFVANIKIVVLAVLIIGSAEAAASATLKFYYGHAPEVDRNGGIAPWYTGQNGQYDLRVRIAGETVKRYPWATGDRAIVPAPEYLYNGTWAIDYEGGITVPPEKDWANGDLGQRAATTISGLMNSYRKPGFHSQESLILIAKIEIVALGKLVLPLL